jgi:hypothetical protein
LWFWIKFSSGLAVALAAVYGPIVLLALPRVTPGVTEANLNEYALLVFPAIYELLVFPAITVAVFSAAAAMTCLARNAVYAAILTVAVVYLGFVATSLAVAGARFAQSGIWPENFGDVFNRVSTQQAGAGMLITCFACTLLAWLAVRYDWGQKSRY